MSMFCVILFLIAATVVGAILQSHFLEVELDLRDATQLKCVTKAKYATADSKVLYSDHATEKRNVDYMLEGDDSKVVLATYPRTVAANYHALPVTLTGTNIGIGLGMTNNTPRAIVPANTKERSNPHVPLRHYSQNTSFCTDMCLKAELGLSSFNQHLKDEYKQSHVLILNTALLHSTGFVGLDCGYIQNRLGCFNRVRRPAILWRANISSTIKASSFPSEEKAWENATTLGKALGGNIPIYDEVFVIDAMYDFNFHHIIVDSVARLVPFYHYLRRHPHIKIHVRGEERFINTSYPGMAKLAAAAPLNRRRVFDLLGFPPERIVSGNLIARKLYLPNDIECMSPIRHALGLHQLTKLLQAQALKEVKSGTCDNQHPQKQRRLAAGPALKTKDKKYDANQRARLRPNDNKRNEVVLPPTRANILIQARSCYLPPPANQTRTDWRCLVDSQTQQLQRAIKEVFPQSKVELISTSLSTPLACDIAPYRKAHVVIGIHGAAMTNVMFMRPGTVLVEIVGEQDLRMSPVCGFYGPYSSVFGVHHFLYYYDGLLDADSLDMVDVVKHAYSFYTSIRKKVGYTDYSLRYGRFDYNVTTNVGGFELF